MTTTVTATAAIAATDPTIHRADISASRSARYPAVPEGTPSGLECSPSISCTASSSVPSSALPHAYTTVRAPSPTVTSAGPITGSVVPASATAADTVPAGRSRLASSGFARPETTADPPARMSTAGAAAVCRTVSRPSPAAVADRSLTNAVAMGSPPSSRCATAV